MCIDAGTGSVRAVILDSKGNQISIAQEEWSHLSEDGVHSSMGFDCKSNWNLTARIIKESIQNSGLNPNEIKGVTASSMREGIVLYDKDGEELWAVANVDARAGLEVKYLKSNFSGLEEEFYKESGQTFALGALPRILWLKNNRPKLYERAEKISMISDWVLYKLSNVIAAEPSNAGTSGVFSLQNRDWAPHQAKRIGIRDSIFPKVYESGEVIGEVSKSASLECGLAIGTKVISGGGDVQLGSLGLGIDKIGDAAILGGTFWQQVVNISSDTPPPLDMGIRINPSVLKGQSQAEGITFFSGYVMRWFRDIFCRAEVAEAAARGIDPYALLEELASKVAVGSNGIMPIFSDVMHYGKWYHAAPSFLNLSLDTTKCNIGAMFRSLQENAAIVSAINLEQIATFSGAKIDNIVFAGGASKGFLWSQIVSDCIGKPLKIPVVKEATSLGGAMLCSIALKESSSTEEAKEQFVKWEKEVEPNMENHRIYKEISAKWQEIYTKELSLVDAGLTESMWKAPGL